jgi:hypothetical protein
MTKHTGWTDPATQTGSDDETTTIKHTPIRQRFDRARVYKDHGFWWVEAPLNDKRFPIGDGTERVHIAPLKRTFEEALDVVRLELAKEAA